MAYNEYISRTDADALIPDETSREILTDLTDSFWLLQLARRLPDMSTKTRSIPVMTGLAAAGFVSGDTGLKITTDVTWDGVDLVAEEVAVIVPIPEAVLDDADYDIWGQVRPAIVEAFGRVLTGAVLYGTDIPAAWTTGLGGAGLVARATTASQYASIDGFTDFYEAFEDESAPGSADGMLMMLEADGFGITGTVGHVGIKGLIRNTRDANGQKLYASTDELGGAPAVYPLDGTISSTYKLISGDWQKLVYSMRQDMTYKILDQAVITGADGSIIWNFAQQDMVGMRCVMRIAFAAPNPINRMQATASSRCPWAYLTA